MFRNSIVDKGHDHAKGWLSKLWKSWEKKILKKKKSQKKILNWISMIDLRLNRVSIQLQGQLKSISWQIW